MTQPSRFSNTEMSFGSGHKNTFMYRPYEGSGYMLLVVVWINLIPRAHM